ncbi:MAG: hypothetical protein J7493_16530 [Porphyrobacter sp.]|nr:hypothetical protein [Porphyrobacter sp.]
MTDRQHKSSAEEAPELHNAEQDDEESQAQTVANEALTADDEDSPLDSEKSDDPGEVMDDSTQDLIDHMRDMEQSGRIDMGAYLGEPNMDDEDETLGEGHDPDED